MEEQNQKEESNIDWNKEKENLRVGTYRNWWKPTPGQHKISFLTDGEKYTTFFDEREVHKVRFDVHIDGEDYSWGVVLGETQNSLYGQLVLIADSWGGLQDKAINLIVKGVGKETSYAVIEALPLMHSEDKIK